MSKTDPRIAAAQRQAVEVEKKYGHKAGTTGFTGFKHGVVSTGSLAWDYQSGIGGHQMGALEEVFGPEHIGKTTIAAFSAMRNAQEQGMLTGYIAVEPDVEEDWMQQHGVNLDYNVTARPDNGEEAFGILSDWVYGGVVDYIVFDSIGAISARKEIESDNVQAYGNSALITWGVKRIAARAWKNGVGVMFINQIRDDTKSRIAGTVTSPGGHAFKHMMKVRTQLKPGKDRYMIKVNDGVDNKDVMAGRQIIASFKKNKAAQALDKAARFDFYHMETDDYPFGFDVAKDVFTAAKLAGIFGSGTWLQHPIFPKGKINGREKAQAFILEHPECIPEIREEVLKVMTKESAKKAEAVRRAKNSAKPTLKVVEPENEDDDGPLIAIGDD